MDILHIDLIISRLHTRANASKSGALSIGLGVDIRRHGKWLLLVDFIRVKRCFQTRHTRRVFAHLRVVNLTTNGPTLGLRRLGWETSVAGRLGQRVVGGAIDDRLTVHPI